MHIFLNNKVLSTAKAHTTITLNSPFARLAIARLLIQNDLL